MNPNHVAVDETVIQLNSERYWLYAAVDPNTNRLLHVWLYPTRTSTVSSMFLSELHEKHQVDDAVFLVDGAPWLQAACHRHGLRFQHVTHGTRNAVERVFHGVKHRTNQFSNMFSHVEQKPLKIGYKRSPSHGIRISLSKHYPLQAPQIQSRQPLMNRSR